MKARTELAARWMYRGIFAALVRWFRVPAESPTLPARPGEDVQSFRPAEGFLRYLKFLFWIMLLPMDFAITVGWIAITIALPWLGIILLPFALFLAVMPDVLVYIALHLRYDTTWYVMTDRSMRIRRGIWVINEVTITFENVQNIRIQAGPLQRYFGIANLIVETAGGGASGKPGHTDTGHTGVIEGIDNAPALRDKILQRLRQSTSAGLGDEAHSHPSSSNAWTPAQLNALRAIRDEVRMLASTST